jgi:DNA topoisomerase IB
MVRNRHWRNLDKIGLFWAGRHGLSILQDLKIIILFQRYLDTDETRLAKTIHHYLVNNKAYGETGVRDVHMQLNGVTINVSFFMGEKMLLQGFVQIIHSARPIC